MKQYILFLALCINPDFSSAEETQNPLQPRIVGGRNATQNEFPFVVALLLDRDFTCSGSIINQYKVLTAAHCINDTTYDQWLVRAGFYYWHATNVIERYVGNMKMHRRYETKGDPTYDIGIMDVTESFEFNAAIHPVVLPRFHRRIKPGTKAVAIGWGLSQFKPTREYPLILQALEVVTIGTRRCRTMWKELNKTICAVGKSDSENGCIGDSGGPMMVGNVQWGMIFRSTANCTGGGPIKFLEISRFTKWIRRFSKIPRQNN
ncbi:serine protease 48-like isoform X2 [Periplaneta americana]|uniref:serine protease 48-like isoform X2 n=1 Tax=Periplaneta americana TaxID=6978 RepID=UPI0037E71387